MALLIKGMAELYGFTPSEVSELTPSQAEALLAESPEEARIRGEGGMMMTFTEARRIYGRK